MSLPDRKDLLVGSSISSWEGMPAIHGDHPDERQASGFWIGSTSRQLLRSHCSSMTHVRRKNAAEILALARLHLLNAAAQTRTVSATRIW